MLQAETDYTVYFTGDNYNVTSTKITEYLHDPVLYGIFLLAFYNYSAGLNCKYML